MLRVLLLLAVVASGQSACDDETGCYGACQIKGNFVPLSCCSRPPLPQLPSLYPRRSFV